ncbi:hypothetical protein ACIBG7_15055 [Nonomuraea sp. NPDC050328]|uniref:hypothetical protein n=1 Tax=Nonomuraea sp. NPDC050328 TaxID=3364361 RepID=UPI0037968EDD
MSYFVPGEIVDITIKGARVVEVCRHGDGNGDDLRFRYESKTGESWPSAIWADAPGVTVERVAPEEWPPQPGDLWRDGRGNLWFAARHIPDYDNHEDSRGINGDGFRTVLVPSHLGEAGAPERPENVVQPFGPFALVRREASS